jgi:thioredoxin-like negative regulator of GroEL
MKIIKFYASWCRPCGVLSHTLDSMTLPHPIETANIDKMPQLAGEYGVRGVPTLVL